MSAAERVRKRSRSLVRKQKIFTQTEIVAWEQTPLVKFKLKKKVLTKRLNLSIMLSIFQTYRTPFLELSQE